jgi:hypothetical protein
MKLVNAVLSLTVGILGITEAGSALARGGHAHGGGRHVHFPARVAIFAAAPVFPRYFYPYPTYVYPLVPAQDPTYIEQVPPQSADPGQGAHYWYYCNATKTYYPYVKDCPGGWQAVVPQPPPPS